MRSQIVLAAGCFWGVEELLRHVRGVLDTEVGYCGGHTKDPTYDTVKTGQTGHAEAIRVDYDSSQLSLERIFELFFQLHDPTTLNRQGNDVGTQYRSAIFVQNETERRIAEEVKSKVDASGRWSRPVVTTIEEAKPFYPAEREHQDYLQRYPDGYTCHFWRGPRPQ